MLEDRINPLNGKKMVEKPAKDGWIELIDAS